MEEAERGKDCEEYKEGKRHLPGFCGKNGDAGAGRAIIVGIVVVVVVFVVVVVLGGLGLGLSLAIIRGRAGGRRAKSLRFSRSPL